MFNYSEEECYIFDYNTGELLAKVKAKDIQKVTMPILNKEFKGQHPPLCVKGQHTPLCIKEHFEFNKASMHEIYYGMTNHGNVKAVGFLIFVCYALDLVGVDYVEYKKHVLDKCYFSPMSVTFYYNDINQFSESLTSLGLIGNYFDFRLASEQFLETHNYVLSGKRTFRTTNRGHKFIYEGAVCEKKTDNCAYIGSFKNLKFVGEYIDKSVIKVPEKYLNKNLFHINLKITKILPLEEEKVKTEQRRVNFK